MPSNPQHRVVLSRAWMSSEGAVPLIPPKTSQRLVILEGKRLGKLEMLKRFRRLPPRNRYGKYPSPETMPVQNENAHVASGLAGFGSHRHRSHSFNARPRRKTFPWSLTGRKGKFKSTRETGLTASCAGLVPCAVTKHIMMASRSHHPTSIRVIITG